MSETNSNPMTEEKTVEFLKALELAKTLPGVKVEVTGVWIWLSGDTKANKETIKESGLFRWAHKKSMWYFAGVRSTGRSGGKDLGYIRSKYGSVIVKDSK